MTSHKVKCLSQLILLSFQICKILSLKLILILHLYKCYNNFQQNYPLHSLFWAFFQKECYFLNYPSKYHILSLFSSLSKHSLHQFKLCIKEKMPCQNIYGHDVKSLQYIFLEEEDCKQKIRNL